MIASRSPGGFKLPSIPPLHRHKAPYPSVTPEMTPPLYKPETGEKEDTAMASNSLGRVVGRLAMAALGLTIALASTPLRAGAEVQDGDVITPANASKVENLLSPGSFALVKQGMTMKIIPAEHLESPPPYRAATEKYSPQVALAPDGNLENYVAGLPFPLVEANDPQAATKIMWNFEYRPMSTDDIDERNVEAASHADGSPGEIEHFTFGHLGLYNYVGRTEVPPTPIDAGVLNMDIASRAGVYPVLEPAELRGAGLVRERSILPGVEDNAWEYSSDSRRLRRLPASALSDSFAGASVGGSGQASGVGFGGGGAAGGGGAGGGRATTYASTLDPNSWFGFSGKVTDYSYRLLGERSILASVDGSSPAMSCADDGGRSVCEKWQPRHVYVIEATAKSGSPLSAGTLVPKRIFYIDSEGLFITASDLYDRDGRLWKTLVNFYAYSDRATPAARVAVWPFKRIFQTAMVDEDLTNGFSTVVHTPGLDDREGLYINMGAIDRNFFTPARMVQAGH
jgi:hypothetical protein